MVYLVQDFSLLLIYAELSEGEWKSEQPITTNTTEDLEELYLPSDSLHEVSG